MGSARPDSLLGRGCTASEACRFPGLPTIARLAVGPGRAALRAAPVPPSGTHRERRRRRSDRRHRKEENGRRPSDRPPASYKPADHHAHRPRSVRLSRQGLAALGKDEVNENPTSHRSVRSVETGPLGSAALGIGGATAPVSTPLGHGAGSTAPRPLLPSIEDTAPSSRRSAGAREARSTGGARVLCRDGRRRPAAFPGAVPRIGHDLPFEALFPPRLRRPRRRLGPGPLRTSPGPRRGPVACAHARTVPSIATGASSGCAFRLTHTASRRRATAAPSRNLVRPHRSDPAPRGPGHGPATARPSGRPNPATAPNVTNGLARRGSDAPSRNLAHPIRTGRIGRLEGLRLRPRDDPGERSVEPRPRRHRPAPRPTPSEPERPQPARKTGGLTRSSSASVTAPNKRSRQERRPKAPITTSAGSCASIWARISSA